MRYFYLDIDSSIGQLRLKTFARGQADAITKLCDFIDDERNNHSICEAKIYSIKVQEALISDIDIKSIVKNLPEYEQEIKLKGE